MLGTDIPKDPHILKRAPKPKADDDAPPAKAGSARGGVVNTVALRGSRRVSNRKDRAPPVPRLPVASKPPDGGHRRRSASDRAASGEPLASESAKPKGRGSSGAAALQPIATSHSR